MHHENHGVAHNTIAQDQPAWQAPPTPRRSAIKPPDNFGAFEALGSGMWDDSCKQANSKGDIFVLSQILGAIEPWQIPLSKCVNPATHDASFRRSLLCCHCLQQQPLTAWGVRFCAQSWPYHMADCTGLLLLYNYLILSLISAIWMVIHHRGLEHRPPTFVTPRTKATMLLGDPTPAPEVLTRFACCMWLLNCVTSWQLGITPIVKTFWTGAGRSSLWSGAGRVPSPSRSIFWSLQSFPVLNGWGPRGNFPRRGRSSPSSRRSGSDFQVLEWRWLASPK